MQSHDKLQNTYDTIANPDILCQIDNIEFYGKLIKTFPDIVN